jgi:hypothetical protein
MTTMFKESRLKNIYMCHLELGATTYNGIEGGETKQRDGAHHHCNKFCSIIIFDGDGTLACHNGGDERHWGV